mgnify:CR=1 FL=1
MAAIVKTACCHSFDITSHVNRHDHKIRSHSKSLINMYMHITFEMNKYVGYLILKHTLICLLTDRQTFKLTDIPIKRAE